MNEEIKVEQVMNFMPDRKGFKNPQNGRVYNDEGLSPTLMTMTGGNRQPKILQVMQLSSSQNSRVVSSEGLSPAVINGEKDGQPKIIQRSHGFNPGGVYELAPTVTTSAYEQNNFVSEATSYRIRKLTERECFRLMDVDEENIDRIQAAGISRTQQYKMAGNSIVVSCMEHIFRKLFIDTRQESGQLSLFG